MHRFFPQVFPGTRKRKERTDPPSPPESVFSGPLSQSSFRLRRRRGSLLSLAKCSHFRPLIGPLPTRRRPRDPPTPISPAEKMEGGFFSFPSLVDSSLNFAPFGKQRGACVRTCCHSGRKISYFRRKAFPKWGGKICLRECERFQIYKNMSLLQNCQNE